MKREMPIRQRENLAVRGKVAVQLKATETGKARAAAIENHDVNRTLVIRPLLQQLIQATQTVTRAETRIVARISSAIPGLQPIPAIRQEDRETVPCARRPDPGSPAARWCRSPHQLAGVISCEQGNRCTEQVAKGSNR